MQIENAINHNVNQLKFQKISFAENVGTNFRLASYDARGPNVK